jgi:GNAT superfamily N-acetyltransferase
MFPDSTFQLRLADERDIALVQELTAKVWPQTYASILSPEQIQYMLEMSYSTSALERQMREGHQFYIAMRGNEAIGFASVSESKPGEFKLHKIYLLGSEQGKGTGRLMLETIMQVLRTRGGKRLELNVNRYNKARQFYEKLGFTVIKEEDIDIGEGFFMNDYVMARSI